MKLYPIVTQLFLLFFAIQVNALARQENLEFNKLKLDDKTAVLTWLNRSCAVGEENKLEQQLIAIDSNLDPVFWEAYQLGPTDEELTNKRAAVITDYKERVEWLQKYGAEAMGKEEAKKELATSEDEYVAGEINKYTNGYKTSALSGLGLIGAPQSLNNLKRIAEDQKNPAQIAAQEALKSISLRAYKPSPHQNPSKSNP